MMKLLLIVLATATLTACGCHSGKIGKKTAKTMICGGYTEQRKPNTEETVLFNEMTSNMEGVVYTPESVATQVVAGINYRFLCKAVTTGEKPTTYQAEVTIYKPLPNHGNPELTQIRKL